MNISVHQSFGPLWMAVDTDTYDGAPDSHPNCRRTGIGEGKEAAIADLMRQIEEDHE